MVRQHQTSDVQLHIGESLDSGFDASHRPGMTVLEKDSLSRHGRARPGHPRLSCLGVGRTWMPGTRPGMTSFAFAGDATGNSDSIFKQPTRNTLRPSLRANGSRERALNIFGRHTRA
jgi:hypothetical protein